SSNGCSAETVDAYGQRSIPANSHHDLTPHRKSDSPLSIRVRLESLRPRLLSFDAEGNCAGRAELRRIHSGIPGHVVAMLFAEPGDCVLHKRSRNSSRAGAVTSWTRPLINIHNGVRL